MLKILARRLEIWFWSKTSQKKKYSSVFEFYDDLNDLMKRMEGSGNTEAAAEIREGLSCINGLTDGWALLMEHLEKALANHKKALRKDQIVDLKNAIMITRKAVYRP
jgi:hypothetical protein